MDDKIIILNRQQSYHSKDRIKAIENKVVFAILFWTIPSILHINIWYFNKSLWKVKKLLKCLIAIKTQYGKHNPAVRR